MKAARVDRFFIFQQEQEKARRSAAHHNQFNAVCIFLEKNGELDREPPTVDSERDLGLSHADPGHDGLAHILASVRLAH